MEKKKNLEVVSGDGSNLDISPVYDYLNVAKPKSAKKTPTGIVIPKKTNNISKDKKHNNDEKKEEN